MTRTVSALSQPANGDVPPVVATPAMDLRDAIYHTAHSYEGGARALSRRMQTRDKLSGGHVPMNENTFTHKVNPNCFTHNVSPEELRDMMILSKDFRILHSMAADTGHVAIQIGTDASGMTFERVGAMAKEFSDVVSVVSEAQAGISEKGARISPNEMSRIEREAAELIAALNALVINVRGQMAEAR
jgi:hypothetical protein